MASVVAPKTSRAKLAGGIVIEGGVPGGAISPAVPLTSARKAVGFAAVLALLTRKSSVFVPLTKPALIVNVAEKATKFPSKVFPVLTPLRRMSVPVLSEFQRPVMTAVPGSSPVRSKLMR